MHPVVERKRQGATRWLLTAEAAAYLLGARLAFAVLPFHRLKRLFEQPARQPELTGDARILKRREVRGAILRVRQRFPDKTTCFHRAMAAQAMLRRRGVSATVYYGAAAVPGSGLATHAWVQDGEEGVVGHRVARHDRYHVLARYPECTPDPS